MYCTVCVARKYNHNVDEWIDQQLASLRNSIQLSDNLSMYHTSGENSMAVASWTLLNLIKKETGRRHFLYMKLLTISKLTIGLAIGQHCDLARHYQRMLVCWLTSLQSFVLDGRVGPSVLTRDQAPSLYQ